MPSTFLTRLLLPVLILSLQACKKDEAGRCDDSKDNDKNDLTDCEDPACAADPLCAGQVDEVCDDNIDNDGDTLADCLDTDCADVCGGDSCDTATPLSADADVTGDTTGAPNTQAGSCTGADTGEDFYAFTARADQVGQTFVLTLTSDADMGLYTRTDCEDSNTEVACIDDNAGVAATETISFVADAEPLFIFVDGFAPGEEGPYTLSLGQLIPSAKCDAPPALTVGAATNGDTSLATDDFAGSCTGDFAGEDVFVLTPSAADIGNTLVLALDSDADMGLYVRDNCGDENSELGCVDDVGGLSLESLSINITSADPLFIFVDGFFDPAEVGPYTLSSQIINVQELCNNAQPLVAGPTTGDTSDNGNFFIGSCLFFDAPEDIFSFNVEAADVGKVLQLSLDSSEDLALYVRSSCNDEDSELGCADNAGSGSIEVLSVTLTAPGALTVFVDGFFDSVGPYTLNARVVDVPALCAAAAGNVIALGDTTGDTSDNIEDNFSASCTGVGGLEDIFFFTPDIADVGGTLRAVLTSSADMGIYARADCADDASELACADFAVGLGAPEEIILPLSDQSQLTLFVDGEENGAYNLLLEVLPPEDVCDDQLDNDLDGLIDCEDATVCQASAACTAGNTALGQPCSANNECIADNNDPLCFSESLNGFPGGYCSEFCSIDDECGDGNFCLFLLNSTNGQCFDACDPANGDGDCLAGYNCLDAFGDGTVNLCFPGCTDDAQCPATGHCNVDPDSLGQGFCTFVEDCSNGIDDDLDGLFDCEDTDNDTDCSLDTNCQDSIINVCSGATTIDTANPSADGDTSGFLSDTGLFVGSCVGSGTAQQIFSFIPAASGTGILNITLTSATDHGVYVRSDCVDAATELGCANDQLANTDEVLSVGVVDASLALSIFVEAATTDDIGPFTLTLSFIPDVCGDSTISGAEECDDGDADPADGCSDLCQVEAGFVCNGEPSVCIDLTATCDAAIAANPGANAGDTTNGTNLFEGSCTGGFDAPEQIFSFTPSTTGDLTLTLASATDQGIYVRTECADEDTELGCVDDLIGGDDEVLIIPVAAGVPLTIFVDGFFDPSEAGPFTLTIQ